MKRLFAAALSLAFIFAVAHSIHAQNAPAASNKLAIKSFTGQIQIKLADGSIIGVVPGAAMPTIPDGAEVVIVSGEAVFESGGTVVNAKAGDSFSFKSSGGQVSIAGTGGNNVTVTVGKTQAAVKNGASVSVSGSGTSGKITVASGEVAMTTDGKTSTLSTGQSVAVAIPTTSTAASSTSSETTVVVVEEGTTESEIDAILAQIGLTADQVTVTNPAADEAIEEEEGIASDTSPSSP